MNKNEQINIAVGSSARTKVWKNTKLSWEEMVNKLTTENKTKETFKEYTEAKKEDQGKIKDVGGYVGGYLKNGRRKPENIIYRQLLTLDIDFAHPDLWEDFCLSFGNAAILHSTHSHSEEKPRYRLIMPLSREVTADEYVAIARQIAGILGIDFFDNTTFEVNRLMFWPSNSKDIPYYSEVQNGLWVDADTILDSYTDWQDSSLWPTAKKDTEKVHTAIKKQMDPEAKTGIIGAFCRAYSITEAIETFLKEEYKPAGDNRYTYIKGTTSAGLLIYEDKFAYSHHGTDPAGGKLCNSFDLIRIHKYGHLDQAGSESKSFKAMEDFCLTLSSVKQAIAKESVSNAKSEFTESMPSAFICRNLKNQLNEAALKPPLRPIIDDFIYENDLCVIFAGPNAGKTLFGTQILEIIASGKNIGGFESQVRGPVLYLDMEMDDRKLAKRYGTDNNSVYQFNENIIRMSLDRGFVGRLKAKNIIEEAIDRMKYYKAKLLFVDNFSTMGTDHEKSADALELMRLFRQVTIQTNGTIIIAAHTPKRNGSEILQVKDLAGSAVIGNFADSIVGLGEDFRDSNRRYLKGFKNRDAEKKYGGQMVLECEIKKADNGLLFFDMIGPSYESEMLVSEKEVEKTRRNSDILDLRNEGLSYKDIAIKLDMPRTTIQSIIKRAEK